MHSQYVGVCNELQSKNLVNPKNKYPFLLKNYFFYNYKKICYLCLTIVG